MAIARHHPVEAVGRKGRKREATDEGERHEQGHGGRDTQAGFAPANPNAIGVPDVQAGNQLFSAGCVGQDRCRLERHEG